MSHTLMRIGKSSMMRCQKFVAPAVVGRGLAVDGKHLGPGLRPAGPTVFSRFIRYLLFLCTVLCILRTIASAADFQISASLDRNQIALTEQAVLSVTITGSGNDLPQPQLPGLADFQIYNAGRSQSFSWVNGKASASVTYNFVLTPAKEGHFTIPGIRIQAGGQTSETPPMTLDVAKGSPSAVQGTAEPEGAARPTPAAHGPPAVFITGTVDKSSVYVGEPVTFTFRLYHRVPLMSRPNYQAPEMTGFWTEDLPPQRNFSESVKGMPYNVVEVRTALFPSTPGKSRIGSANLTVNLENFG
ncbi:MAG TPA: BatD family protein, partial [Candidatus Sulfotelmatobacter sp.]|nr:BatD family protein [Candidatus Sulfotelmatobacter sp.]